MGLGDKKVKPFDEAAVPGCLVAPAAGEASAASVSASARCSCSTGRT
jgi:hypothetical protein